MKKSQKTPQKPFDGYQMLKDNPAWVAAIERMANVKVVFEEEPEMARAIERAMKRELTPEYVLGKLGSGDETDD